MESIARLVATASLLLAGCDVEQRQAPAAPAAQVSSQPVELEALRDPWTFTIQNEERKPIGSLTVRFTGEPAKSCIEGNWKRVIVVAYKSFGEPAFPGTEPLAYEVDARKLTVGRINICDGYLMLGGNLTEKDFSGEYYSLGLQGVHRLGFVQGTPSSGPSGS